MAPDKRRKCLQCLVEEYSSLLREDPDVELELSVLRSPSGKLGAFSGWFADAARVHAECLAEEPCLLCDARGLAESRPALDDWLEERGFGGVFGAIRHGAPGPELRALLSNHEHLARRDRAGRSFIGMAFAFGAHVDLLDALLDAGVPVHADDWDAIPFPGPYQQLDLAPLARALQRGGVDVDGLDLHQKRRQTLWSRRNALLARLSSRGVEIRERFRPPRLGVTPLLRKALADGAHEAFLWLAARSTERFEDASLLDQAMRAVLWASERDAAAALDRLRMLLRAGLDPNSGSPEPAFYSVVGVGSPEPRAGEVLSLLKEAGADFTRPGPHRFDMVTWACAHGALDLAKLLGRPGWAALCMVCDPRLWAQGNDDDDDKTKDRHALADWVLGHAVDLEKTGFYFFNETALVMAIKSGDRALVDRLVSRGASLFATDRNGTPAAELLESMA